MVTNQLRSTSIIYSIRGGGDEGVGGGIRKDLYPGEPQRPCRHAGPTAAVAAKPKSAMHTR